MPLADVVHGPSTLVPSHERGLLMWSRRPKEAGPTCLVGIQWYGSLGDVQMETTPVSQQDAAGFWGTLVALPMPGEYSKHGHFDQDEAIVVGSSQEEGIEHPGHPSSGETFWFLTVLASAPSM